MNLTRRTELKRRRHSSQRLTLESLEPRVLLAGDPILDGQPVIISELMADNLSTLLTRTRTSTADAFAGQADSPDWIELLNVSGQQLDLGGMHLTDDPARPAKWSFPAGTSLEAGAMLLVLASGDDIRDPALDEHGLLHTNFALSSGGDYLALTDRLGAVIHEFSPTFPTQRTDVSYAVPMDARTFVGPDAAVEYLVPTDDSLPPQWRMPGFTDANLVGGAGGLTSPVGFDRGGGPVVEGETTGAELIERPSIDFASGSLVVLESTPMTEAGRVAEWSFYSEKARAVTPLILRAVDGQFEIVGIGRTRTSDGSGPQTFAFDLQSGSDSVEPDGYYFGFKDGDNQTDNPGVIVWGRSDSDTIRRYNGPLSGSVVVGQQLSGGREFKRTFSVQATTHARLAGPINTQVDSAMSDATSLYVRYPFQVEGREMLRTLSLNVRYDDGFVAYLNGTEVARRNVPDSVHFDSTATSDRPIAEANRFEEINISRFIGALTEGENVLAVHALNDHRDGTDFLLDVRLVGNDLRPVAEAGYAADPTPGFSNGELFSGFVSAPALSREHGFYDEPFTLQLSTPGAPDAAIYFTTDGSDPTPDSPTATRYQQPLEIAGTTILRAASYQPQWLPSPARTQTYLFPQDVARQSTLQAAVTDDPVWGPQLPDSLRALPTVSLVTETEIAIEGEIETSVELIFPDGQEGFQVDAGVEVYGGTAVSFPKRSMRLSFKNVYGPSTLNFDVFGDPDGVTEFDQLLLRPGSHDAPFWSGADGDSVYIRNRWANDRQLEMGQPAPRGRFVHLYLNGAYSGQYQLMERANAAFMASNFGGKKKDYDALNAGTPIDGDDVAWNALLDAVGDGYDAVKQYLDVDNYADYLLLEFYGGNNWDWRADSNWMAARKREPGAGFQFFAWDSDLILRLGADANNVYYGGPGFLWTADGGVKQYPEFRRLLAERAQQYFFDDGLFTDESLRHQMDAFVEQLGVSIIAETARWGSGTYTPDTWLAAIDWIKDTYAPEGGPSRAATVIEQLRQAGLFPLSDRPQFSTDGQPLEGNRVAAGTQLTMSAPEGTIYYTLDGGEPWQRAPTVEYATLIGESAPVRVLVPPDNALQSAWLELGFDDSRWMRGEGPVGYDTTGEFTPLIGTDVQEQMKDVNATAYLRVPFQVDDPRQFDTLELSMRYDDGFVAYLNGTEIARRNAPDSATWNSRANRVHPNVEAIEWERFNLSRVRHLLQPGENVLAIQAMNSPDKSNVDLLVSPVLRAGTVIDTGVSSSAIRYSQPITVPPGAFIKARAVWGDQWSTLREAATAAPQFPLRISEIMYHPADPDASEQSAGFTDGDDFEFIELTNVSSSPLELAGVQLVQTTAGGATEGVGFDFGTGGVSRLDPGQRVLVVEDLAAFPARYGNNLPVAGQWTGGLSNSSETVTLMANDVVVQQFAYDDRWYPQTDGQGSSLELIDVPNTPVDQYQNSRWWQASRDSGGTPGRPVGSPRVLGDANGDGRFNQQDLVLVLAAGKYQTGQPATFEQGDFNGDGVFDRYDIVEVLAGGDFQPAGAGGGAARAGTSAAEPGRPTPSRGQGISNRPAGDLSDLALTEIFEEKWL